VRPSVAEEPLRKWPSSERVLRSRCSLRQVSSPSAESAHVALGEGAGHSQIGVHLDKCALGLGEEVVYDAPAELALVFILVHFEDLLKRRRVDAVGCAGDGHDAFFAVLVAD
jgi:hypothetical protein